MDDPTRFEQLLQFRVPANLSEALDVAARQKCQSKSVYSLMDADNFSSWGKSSNGLPEPLVIRRKFAANLPEQQQWGGSLWSREGPVAYFTSTI